MNENNEHKIDNDDKDFDTMILLVKSMHNRQNNAEMFADIAAKFLKYPCEEFKLLLVKAADNLIFGENAVKKCVSMMGID